MVGKVDTKGKVYQSLFAWDDPLTGGEVWLSKAMCEDCASLFESADQSFLPIVRCSNCNGDRLVRPPAYGPIQLEAWWRTKLANRSQESVRVHKRMIGHPNVKAEMHRMDKARQQKSQPQLDPGPEVALTEIIERSQDMAAFRKKRNLEVKEKGSQMIRDARKEEGPNVEKKYNIITPPFFSKK